MNEKKWKSVKQQRVKQQEKISEARSWLFKKVNKIHKTFASLINKKKENIQMINIRNSKMKVKVLQILNGYYETFMLENLMLRLN